MNSPFISVVIPAYNQADFLAEAIQSVLDQTYSYFELIVVNDASPDHTADVVKGFDDPRLITIAHEKNRGLPATRNTGIRAATGDLIALLDSDDYFHPEKLETHLKFLAKHPEIGVTYNSRFELNYSTQTIRELVRPPLTVTLGGLVLGYPFTPSDTVCRRDWLLRVDLFDERCVNGGEDLDLPARLALAGCHFASVDRALNYRRHHSGRRRKNLAARLAEVLSVLETIFADPRCPNEVLALRNIAFSNNYLVYAEYALAYGETGLGHTYLREATRLNPSILNGNPCALVRFLITNSIADESVDHIAYLRNIFAQFPPELMALSEQFDWAVGQGFLLKGIRAIMWNRQEDGRRHFARAAESGAEVDQSILQELVFQLLNYENEFGPDATQSIVEALTPYLEQVGNRYDVRRLKGCYSANGAFHSYRSGRYREVPGKVARAIINDPKYLANRGIGAIMIRSIMNRRKQLED